MSDLKQIQINTKAVFVAEYGYELLSNRRLKDAFDFYGLDYGIDVFSNSVLDDIFSDNIVFSFSETATITVFKQVILNRIKQEFNISESVDALSNEIDMIIVIDKNYAISFEDDSKTLWSIVKHFDIDNINVRLVFYGASGELFRENGFRFYFHSHEGSKHNEPHVHVESKDFRTGTFDLIQNRYLRGSLRKQEITKITKIIKENQRILLEGWNKLTDGIVIDVDYLIGQSEIRESE